MFRSIQAIEDRVDDASHYLALESSAGDGGPIAIDMLTRHRQHQTGKVPEQRRSAALLADD